MSILLIVLVLMNPYPLLVSEDLVFRAKHPALQASATAVLMAEAEAWRAAGLARNTRASLTSRGEVFISNRTVRRKDR